MTDTSPEAVERLADYCLTAGNKAHEQVGCALYMRVLWTAETTLRALAVENARLRWLLCQAREWNWLDAEDYDEEYWSCLPMMKMLSDDIDAALKENDND